MVFTRVLGHYCPLKLNVETGQIFMRSTGSMWQSNSDPEGWKRDPRSIGVWSCDRHVGLHAQASMLRWFLLDSSGFFFEIFWKGFSRGTCTDVVLLKLEAVDSISDIRLPFAASANDLWGLCLWVLREFRGLQYAPSSMSAIYSTPRLL